MAWKPALRDLSTVPKSSQQSIDLLIIPKTAQSAFWFWSPIIGLYKNIGISKVSECSWNFSHTVCLVNCPDNPKTVWIIQKLSRQPRDCLLCTKWLKYDLLYVKNILIIRQGALSWPMMIRIRMQSVAIKYDWNWSKSIQ